MTDQPNAIGQVLVGSLRLSSDQQHEREKAAEAKRSDYRRSYWQKYRKTVSRVYGTMPPAEYEALKARAKANNRAAWEQLVAEARAYRDGDLVPTPEMLDLMRQAIRDINAIGNNINQLTKLGHLQSQKRGPWGAAPGTNLQDEVLRQLSRLEAKVTLFAGSAAVRRTKRGAE